MWIRWMDDLGGGCRRALDEAGGLLDPEATLEDVRKTFPEDLVKLLSNLLLVLTTFFCTEPYWQRVTRH